MSTYSPSFNLTLNGASASDSNERKVKRWVREAIREAMDGMGTYQSGTKGGVTWHSINDIYIL